MFTILSIATACSFAAAYLLVTRQQEKLNTSPFVCCESCMRWKHPSRMARGNDGTKTGVCILCRQSLTRQPSHRQPSHRQPSHQQLQKSPYQKRVDKLVFNTWVFSKICNGYLSHNIRRLGPSFNDVTQMEGVVWKLRPTHSFKKIKKFTRQLYHFWMTFGRNIHFRVCPDWYTEYTMWFTSLTEVQKKMLRVHLDKLLKKHPHP